MHLIEFSVRIALSLKTKTTIRSFLFSYFNSWKNSHFQSSCWMDNGTSCSGFQFRWNQHTHTQKKYIPTTFHIQTLKIHKNIYIEREKEWATGKCSTRMLFSYEKISHCTMFNRQKKEKKMYTVIELGVICLRNKEENKQTKYKER